MGDMKPEYYTVMWHNCNRCRTHYTSDDPHSKAYLCDNCWAALPHFKTKQRKKEMKPKGTIPAEAWVLFYITVGSLLLIWSLFNIMVNEI